MIVIKNLTKKYKKNIAINNCNLTIKKGEIFGLLGKNGAGKTTLISMLTTLIAPTTGEILINNVNILKNPQKIRSNLGIVFQESIIDDQLSAFNNLDIHARLYCINKQQRHKKINQLLKLIDLQNVAQNRVETYSGGMKRKVELIRGLVNSPQILYLDEPTLGLDIQTRNKIWKYIKKINKKYKMTIILNTHYIEEAEKVCTKVGILHQGKLLAVDTPKNFIDKMQTNIIEIKTKNKKEIILILKQYKKITNIKQINNIIQLHIQNPKKEILNIMKILTKNNIEIESIGIKSRSLEDVFIKITGDIIE